MKVTYITSKSNEQGVRNEIRPFETKGNATLTIRAHSKNDQLIVCTVSSNSDQIQDNFRRYLKMRESQNMLRSLKIHEIDGMGFATVNGIREEAKA